MIVVYILFLYGKPYQKKEITIKEKVIHVSIADTYETRAKGLSNTDPLLENEGMLFVFATPGYYGFWMKDMKYPLDIIWLDKNYKVVSLQKDISPESYPTIFKPQVLASYVLEVPAGFVELYGIQNGDFVSGI